MADASAGVLDEATKQEEPVEAVAAAGSAAGKKKKKKGKKKKKKGPKAPEEKEAENEAEKGEVGSSVQRRNVSGGECQRAPPALSSYSLLVVLISRPRFAGTPRSLDLSPLPRPSAPLSVPTSRSIGAERSWGGGIWFVDRCCTASHLPHSG